jgi:hypothetical protein
VKCEFSLLDCNQLSIGKFLCRGESVTAWVDVPTREDRYALSKAVRNLSLMCQVNFGGVYRQPLAILESWLVDEGTNVVLLWDLYLRFKIDSRVNKWFD